MLEMVKNDDHTTQIWLSQDIASPFFKIQYIGYRLQQPDNKHRQQDTLTISQWFEALGFQNITNVVLPLYLERKKRYMICSLPYPFKEVQSRYQSYYPNGIEIILDYNIPIIALVGLYTPQRAICYKLQFSK